MNTTTQSLSAELNSSETNSSLIALNLSLSNTKYSEFSHDNQQCFECPKSTYIIDPDRDVCQNCPKGMPTLRDMLVSVAKLLEQNDSQRKAVD